MEKRRLGKHGPEISVVGYGAWEIGGESYGPNASDPEVVEAIHAALDAGMDWIDTAEVYGRGRSEVLVGLAIRGRRDSVQIATKVAPQPTGSGFRPEQVRQALKDSLRRLAVDYIDLYQLHWFPDDRGFRIEETWGEMAKLAEEGLTRFIGVSNFSQEEIQRCMSLRHVDSLQPQFSMLHGNERELIAWCGEQGIGVIVYGPLAYGLLTGTIRSETTFDATDWRSGKWPEHPYYKDLFAPRVLSKRLGQVEKLRPIAESLGITLGQLALAWTFHQPGITAAIAGSRNPEHNKQNAAAGKVRLSQDTLAEIQKCL